MPRYSIIQLADQVQRLLKAGNVATSKKNFDRREIARALRDIAADLIRGEYLDLKLNGYKQIHHQYVVTFDDIKVAKDNNGVNYSDLPAEPMSFPEGEGIMNIWPVGKKGRHNRPLIPLPLNSDVVFTSLPAGALEQRFAFKPYRDRVEYTVVREDTEEGTLKRTMLDENIKAVRIQMVTVDPKDAADNEPFPIAPHLRPMLLTRGLVTFGMPLEAAKQIVNQE